MTTQAEIKRWVRSFVRARQDVAPLPRAVLVTPVGHIARGVYFRATSTKTHPELGWFMEVLFAAPGSWNADFDQRFSIGYSDDAAFAERLDRALTDSFDTYLLPVTSIADFHDFATGEKRRFTFLNLDDYGLEHGTVLAALGRLDEAEALLRATIADCEMWAAAEQRADDEFRNTRSRPRGVIILNVARKKMAIVERVRELLARVETRNRAAIAELLHDWERLQVEKREIAHLWEPTPFPVERVT